ncbi:unnamed protein product (macronuclear) [Paramecium tetraurelia]|uniref:Uncharacterized protein n=1 Tax=Paramecium tetraurelia TaxID=5888 RepID=A0DAY8_PARTE|nr:uncharacterized protein GSPATT00015112001 [Paramecium tetraurelia]CAK80205.1 unnamed protein product [Paramecium tetraurelia]|eukprot:XP_001447602.1 hypothetical protein (macronuclear) [Paramecium tetraurelia strain d4-2]
MQQKLKGEQNFWKNIILKEQNLNYLQGTFYLNYFEEKVPNQSNQQRTDTCESLKNETQQKNDESSEKFEEKFQDDFLDESSIDSSLEPIQYCFMVSYLISPNEQYLVVNTKQVNCWQVSDKIIILDLKNKMVFSFQFKTDHTGAPPTYFLSDYLISVDAKYGETVYFIFLDLLNNWGQKFIITYNYPIIQLNYDSYLNCILILTKKNKIVKQQLNLINLNQELQTVLNFKNGWPENMLDSYPLQSLHILNDSFAIISNSINQLFLIKISNQIQVVKYYYWKSVKSEVIKLPLNNSMAVMSNQLKDISPILVDYCRGRLIRKAPKGGANSHLYSYKGSCFISSIQEEDSQGVIQSQGMIFDILRGNLKYRNLMDKVSLEQTNIKFTHNIIAQYCNDTINYKLIF